VALENMVTEMLYMVLRSIHPMCWANKR